MDELTTSPATSCPAMPVQESSTGFTIAAVAALALAGALLWAAIRGPAISPADVESSAARCSEARYTDERANGVDEHQLGSAVPPQFAQGTLRSRDCNN